MAPIDVSGDKIVELLSEVGKLQGIVQTEGRTTRSRLEAQHRQIAGLRDDLGPIKAVVAALPERCAHHREEQAGDLERAKAELRAELGPPPPGAGATVPAAADVAVVPPPVPQPPVRLLLGLGLVLGLVAGAAMPSSAWPAILAAILRAVGVGS